MFDYCSFVDEDDCTYEYTVETSNDATNTELLVEVLKKKGELQAARIQSGAESFTSCASMTNVHKTLTVFH